LNDWDEYVQSLQEWNKSKQLTDDCQTRLLFLSEILRKFKQFSSLTKLIDETNAHWQIDTIRIHLQRGNTLKEMCKAITTNMPRRFSIRMPIH